MVAEVDDVLLVIHPALVLHAVADLVNLDDLAMGCHRLFHTFALIVSADTVTDQVGHQLEQALGALFGRSEFSDAVHDAVARVAHEVLEEHLVACGLPDDAGPIDFLNRRQFAERSE